VTRRADEAQNREAITDSDADSPASRHGRSGRSEALLCNELKPT